MNTIHNINIVSIIGLGFVGSAMKKSFELKGQTVYSYDIKYSDNKFEDILDSPILFLCLPTPYNHSLEEYDKTPIFETCQKLQEHGYKGITVIKSTVEPGTTQKLAEKFNHLRLVHNPEFLTAVTAFVDFHQQKHIILGTTKNLTEENISYLTNFYQTLYPEAEISICSSLESESVKIYLNCFYAVKVQFFNELFLTSQTNQSDFQVIRRLMLKNGWINPMHTNVPGPDGELSYGGYCFPKDTNALLSYMKKLNVNHRLLEATVEERNQMRNDHINIVK